MTNFIEVYDNALPDDICDSLISIFNREKLNSYRVQEGVTSAGKNDDYKSSLELTLNSEFLTNRDIILDIDYIMEEKILHYCKKYHVIPIELNKKIFKNLNEMIEATPPESLVYRMDKWRIKKYTSPNDGYHAWHADWNTYDRSIQRMLVCQFYLNDVEEGGETEFYHQKIKVKPKKGRLVIWPTSFTHMHKGNKPKSNDKYIVSAWYTK